MPRYFFHVRDSIEFIDHDGTELAGLGGVRAQAVVAAGEVIKDSGDNFWRSEEWHMWVTDETGETVCKLSFRGG